MNVAAGALPGGGRVVIVEWAWEKFDRRTADWCFARLGPDQDESWLLRRRDDWTASGRQWSDFIRDWAGREGIHRADELVRLLDERLEREHLGSGPYLFPDLADTTDSDEEAAIAAGEIAATRIDWVGTRR